MENEDLYEDAGIYHTATIDNVIKALQDAGIKFELDIPDDDIRAEGIGRRGMGTEGPEIFVYVHKDDLEKFQAIHNRLFP